ncbi:NAD(P)-dependent dehydrogenase (short-subunit alcohol dehydrogenase family) [Eilatimonas milleporae]|uniref:NAD(P)-dependent dehydrogenase (Short-subunit alcohol dehydrogenase family) n=1 Tax=Eilatimonas milleporae TaxID=911205 RepID=A0A3M0C1F6_9PROT|nr:NAD(P)-dependent dehydrogenase (short-subunit alcohol dehydrogenase family) [Eilatimonas milleporae]
MDGRGSASVNRLKNKIALVTGASRGIGAAIARLYVSEGAETILTDIDDGAGEALVRDLGPSASYLHLDVSDEDQWLAAADHIAAGPGRLDILVNNAGITGFEETSGPYDPESLDMASWHMVHSVNLDGVALGCKYGIRLMKPSPAASIVNISSRSGMVGIPAAAAYASSKAAVRNHTKSVALYCAQQGYAIRCNSIHPAAILTPIWEPMLGEGAARADALKTLAADIPLGHIGDPDDVAWAAVYLGADESKYVTGAELTIDGGILAGSSASPTRE